MLYNAHRNEMPTAGFLEGDVAELLFNNLIFMTLNVQYLFFKLV